MTLWKLFCLLRHKQYCSAFSDCVLFYYAFQVKSTQIYFDTYFPCISNCWLGQEVCRKLYTLIGGQRAEKFDNHWPKSVS